MKNFLWKYLNIFNCTLFIVFNLINGNKTISSKIYLHCTLLECAKTWNKEHVGFLKIAKKMKLAGTCYEKGVIYIVEIFVKKDKVSS